MPDILPLDQQQPAPAPFVWGGGGVQMTPERIAAARKVAQAMQATGMDYSPVRSPFQGAARVAQALMGAYDERQANQAENANAAADKAMVSSWFGGGAPAAAVPAAGAGAASVPPVPTPAPTVLGEGGQPSVADAQGVYPADAVMMPPTAKPDYGSAIASIESAGQKNPYAAVGPATASGDRAYGKYQVMGANIPAWTKEHLGQEMTPQQFMASPQAQDAVFQGQFGKYVQQTGNPQDAASMWFTGKPQAQGAGLSDVNGTTGQSYVQRFTRALGPAGAPAAAAQADPSALPPNATPTQGAIPPGVPAPTGPVTPTAAPGAQAVAGAMQGVNPGVVAAMQSPYTSDATKKIAALILQHQMGDKVTYQTLPDGTILKMDPMGKNAPVPVYQAPTKPTFGQTGEDAFGNKQYGFIDPITKTITPASGAAGAPAGESAFLAKGVTAVDQELKGPDYLAQFSPEVKSAVQSMIDGNAMPTGNPRKGYTETVKRIAQKYGSDIGIPMDDASFGQRRTMLNNLAVSTPGSLGGQINFAGTSLEHLATTAEKIGELKNVNGLGIAPLAQLVNLGRQLTTEQAGKANAVTGAAQHYGQEVTKFYSGSPGGEGERSRFMQTLSTSKSPTELADALQTERDLIPGRLDQIATQIRTTFGEDTPMARKYLARIEESKKAIPKIDAEIAKLRGGGAAAVAAPSMGGTNKTNSGVTWSVE